MAGSGVSGPSGNRIETAYVGRVLSFRNGFRMRTAAAARAAARSALAVPC